jgi:hypothetical protein
MIGVNKFKIVKNKIIKLKVDCVMLVDCWMMELKLEWVKMYRVDLENIFWMKLVVNWVFK